MRIWCLMRTLRPYQCVLAHRWQKLASVGQSILKIFKSYKWRSVSKILGDKDFHLSKSSMIDPNLRWFTIVKSRFLNLPRNSITNLEVWLPNVTYLSSLIFFFNIKSGKRERHLDLNRSRCMLIYLNYSINHLRKLITRK